MAMKTPIKTAAAAAELEQFMRDEDSILQSTRSYQAEMFEESLKRNIIVAMDTGSGKTHIAILRIRAQLERRDEKISWFLVPGVALGQQQFEVLKSALPPVNMQFLTGASGIDKWSNHDAWNEILGPGDGVVVSTHQVLLDALTHGFVRMDRIGLMVFDEAHHCVAYHPANRIMQDFYHQRLAKGLYVPHILGLTASPITKAQPNQLSVIERNLNALARTPILHRGDLLKYVHVPKLKSVIYNEVPTQAALDKLRLPPQTANFSVASGPALDIDLGNPFEIPGIVPEERSPQSGSNGQSNKRRAEQPLLGNTPLKRIDTSAYESVDPFTGELMASGESDSEYESFDPITGGAVVHDGNRTWVESSNASSEEYEEIDPVTGEPVSASIEFQSAPSQNNAERASNANTSMALESLQRTYARMDVLQDPYIAEIRRGKSPNKQAIIQRLIANRTTYCQEHVKQLVNKGKHLLLEYGSWAADWFIGEAVRQFFKHTNPDEELYDEDQEFGCNDAEQRYLRNILREVTIPTDLGPVEERITPKVKKLLEVLLSEYLSEKEEFSGLVFVEQRVGVVALAEIINCHAETKEYFKTGTMVGSSTNTKRMRFLHDIAGKINTLPEFRTGEKNLVIATSVIEEGLDIKDCHLVVCFAPPNNLKSFVQRRGRARRVQSSYVIMYGPWERHRANEFEAMEQEMVKMYSDTTREIGDVEVEIKEEGQDRQVRIETTGALLTLENSVAHLYHFCACLPAQEFVDLRPEFRTSKSIGLWTSEVVLPNSIHPDIRRFTSRKAWKSAKWAKRDVAFEAYLKLHSLKLVDDHLMPLVKMELQSLKEAEKRSPKAMVEERMDVWSKLGEYWNTRNGLYVSVIQMTFSTGESVGVQILLPVMLPDIENLLLFWSVNETVEVTFGRSTQIQRSPELLKRAKNATFRLLENMHGRRMEKDNFDFAYLLLPQGGDTWDQLPNSQISALEAVQADLDMGVLRDKNDPRGASYVHGRWRVDLSPEELSRRLGREIRNTLPVIEAQRLTRRRDFLHPEAGLRKSEKTVILLPEAHIVGSLPWRYSRLALLLPFAIDRCEKALLAENMKHMLGLESLPINMTVQALTASSARDPMDYQRLEFLGDSVLKFLASIALVDEHPLWHEGYLSGAKDRIVSNAASSKFAIARKLSRWIITKSFTGLKWKPQYITTSPRKEPESKSLSTKVLADVVEALIGVSYLHSGYGGATTCCQVFSLGLTWLPLEQRIINLVSTASTNASKFSGVYPPYFRDLERILGYTFIRPSLLLEAITHLSYGADSLSTSYQRLEFLGDALLDMVVVNRLYSLPGKNLSHIQMHHLKSCCVNAGFLAYLCIGASVDVEATVLTSTTGVERKKRSISLHKFLRHSHSEIPRADAACLKRYQQLRDSIQRQLEEADEYPWVSLAELAAPKHISDIIESLIAAIWVDSSGSFPAVEAFVKKLGIFDVLERLVRDKVEPDHPMSRFGMYVANGGKLGVVKYHVEQEEGGRGYRCEVEVSGEVVATVDGGVSAAHVKTWAAEVGLKVVMERDRRSEEDRMVVDEVREAGEEGQIDEEEGIDGPDSMLKSESALGLQGEMFYDAAEEL